MSVTYVPITWSIMGKALHPASATLSPGLCPPKCSLLQVFCASLFLNAHHLALEGEDQCHSPRSSEGSLPISAVLVFLTMGWWLLSPEPSLRTAHLPFRLPLGNGGLSKLNVNPCLPDTQHRGIYLSNHKSKPHSICESFFHTTRFSIPITISN